MILINVENPIDNNSVEQLIRIFCIDKKEWAMIDAIVGSKSSVIIYSHAEQPSILNHIIILAFYRKKFRSIWMTMTLVPVRIYFSSQVNYIRNVEKFYLSCRFWENTYYEVFTERGSKYENIIYI